MSKMVACKIGEDVFQNRGMREVLTWWAAQDGVPAEPLEGGTRYTMPESDSPVFLETLIAARRAAG